MSPLESNTKEERPHRAYTRLSPAKKYILIGMHIGGMSVPEIARRKNIHYDTVRNIIRKYKETGTVEDMHRSGRPKALSSRDIRHLIKLVRSDPNLTLGEIRKAVQDFSGKRLSKITLSRTFHSLGLK